MGLLKQGYFPADDATLDGQQNLGGVIRRPGQVAAILNSTQVNRRGPTMLRDRQADQYEETDYGFIYGATRANIPVRFQYVQQDAYKGVLPWEVLPQVPNDKPWE